MDRPHRAGSDRPGTIRLPPLTPEAPHGAALGRDAGRRFGGLAGVRPSTESGRDGPGADPHPPLDRGAGPGRGAASRIRGPVEARPGALQPRVAAQRPALPRRRWAGAGVQRDLMRGLPRSGRPRGRGPPEDERRGHQRDRRHHRGLPRRARAEHSPPELARWSRGPDPRDSPGQGSRPGKGRRQGQGFPGGDEAVSTCQRRTHPVGSGMDSWSRRAGRP